MDQTRFTTSSPGEKERYIQTGFGVLHEGTTGRDASYDCCIDRGQSPRRDRELRRLRHLAKLCYMAYRRHIKRILAIEHTEAEDEEGDPLGDEGIDRRR